MASKKDKKDKKDKKNRHINKKTNKKLESKNKKKIDNGVITTESSDDSNIYDDTESDVTIDDIDNVPIYNEEVDDAENVDDTSEDDDLEEDDDKENNDDVDDVDDEGDEHDDQCYQKYADNMSDDEDDDIDILDDDQQKEIKQLMGDDRITKPVLTHYEQVRLLTDRTKQLSLGAKPMIKNSENLSSRQIAHLEIEHNIIPLVINRPLPNGKFEIWKISELKH